MAQYRKQSEINMDYTNVCTQLGDIQCKRRRMVIEEMLLEGKAEALLVEKSIESVDKADAADKAISSTSEDPAGTGA